jgi:formate hydrogenlyase subunit 3/multisubunit Na+/H+ antiporter MnhD subunit
MSASALIPAIGTPFALALLLAFAPLRGIVWRAMPFAPAPALALAVFATAPLSVTEDWLILGTVLGLEATARLFLIAAALVWICAAVAARAWMRDDPQATGFGLCFLLAMAGNLGLFLVADAPSFYALFALMSFAAYGLVLHSRSAAALSAARLYIVFVVAGELALFAGFAIAVNEAGSLMLADLRGAELSTAAVALLLAGFGAKLGVMPLHVWLPPAHGAAPVPASAVLSGAMIKAGLYGITAAVPLGRAAYADPGVVIMSAGLVTIFAALLLAARETSPKSVLGFSSVSQMGIVALGIGASLAVPAAWDVVLPVLVFLAAHHALAKGALFLGTGAVAAQTGRIRSMVMTVALVLPALILAGLPGFSGALGKEALKSALGAGPAGWVPWLTLALTLSGVVTTLIMARFLVQLWRARPVAPVWVTGDALVLPFAALVLGSLALPALWPVLAGGDARPIAEAVPGKVWPVLAGISTAIAAAVDAHTRRVGWGPFLAALTAPITRAAARLTEALARRRRALARRARALPVTLDGWIAARRLGQTGIAALLVTVLVIETVERRTRTDPRPVAPAVETPPPDVDHAAP